MFVLHYLDVSVFLEADYSRLGEFYFMAVCTGPAAPRAGGTPLFGLYGDVPLDRVWFFGLAVLNRVYNSTCLCPKQVRIVLNRVWYYEPRDLNPASSQVLFLACEPEPARS